MSTNNNKKHPLLDTIRERFRYEDGLVIVNKTNPWRGKEGTIAGTELEDGRIRIQVKGQMFFAHHIVWLLFNDDLPPGTLDHIDRDRRNNRIENLRPATNSQQQWNKSLQRNNTSGYRGVSFRGHLKTKPWRASIKKRGKSKFLGYYKTPEDAARAYDTAAIKEFGEYASLNFPNEGQQK